jgi:hypothetical protein
MLRLQHVVVVSKVLVIGILHFVADHRLLFVLLQFLRLLLDFDELGEKMAVSVSLVQLGLVDLSLHFLFDGLPQDFG